MQTLLLVLAVLASVLFAAVRYCIVFPRQPFKGPLPPLPAGARDVAKRLQAHIVAIASEPHNVAYPRGLEAAADYIDR